MVNKSPLGQRVSDESLTLDHTVHNCDISMPLKRISEGGYLWSNQVADMIAIDKSHSISVLDIGCQLGQLFHSLSQTRWQGSYLGLDISEFYVREAKRLFADHDNADFAVHSIEEPVLHRASPLHTVVCSAVFEHTLDPAAALNNMLNAAGQRLILRTMLGAQDEVNTLKIASEYLCRQFCRKDLLSSIEQAGFRVNILTDLATNSEQYKVLDDIEGNATLRQIFILDCRR